jgi:hypothetical protein
MVYTTFVYTRIRVTASRYCKTWQKTLSNVSVEMQLQKQMRLSETPEHYVGTWTAANSTSSSLLYCISGFSSWVTWPTRTNIFITSRTTVGICTEAGGEGEERAYVTPGQLSVSISETVSVNESTEDMEPSLWRKLWLQNNLSNTRGSKRIYRAHGSFAMTHITTTEQFYRSRKLTLTTVEDPPRWPHDTPLSTKVGTKFRRQVAVDESA